MSGYNQEDQGKRPLKDHERGSQGAGQNPPPKPGQQEELPDKDILDGKTQEQLRKDNVANEEKGLIRQLPGGESG
ncbi:hypothetical protein AFIC_001123 [[Pseudomonas] carboxydohydrogena]|uniref:Uncharacterized protein n=1 Tax=Afipia carboxydohydrogena TaxID=290 RepID=A0ABY8BRK6_AFICR|nr:hypothetical protein [[Pseudomonas] carboxydohydrogena]WEF52628.1 hypothetical protein AFIC_001123 [[Pseudomonas] carboxydohydrogena]